MTDLISALADSLLALINSQMRSPTKQEIEDVLRAQLTDKMLPGEYQYMTTAAIAAIQEHEKATQLFEKDRAAYIAERDAKEDVLRTGVAPSLRMMLDAGELASYPGLLKPRQPVEIPPDTSIRDALMPLPYTNLAPTADLSEASLSTAISQDRDQIGQAAAIASLCRKLYLKQREPVHQVEQAMDACKAITKDRDEVVRIAQRYAVDARGDYDTANSANHRCPLSNNGTHHYEHMRPVVPQGLKHNDVNLPPPPRRCVCGATKP